MGKNGVGPPPWLIYMASVLIVGIISLYECVMVQENDYMSHLAGVCALAEFRLVFNCHVYLYIYI